MKIGNKIEILKNNTLYIHILIYKSDIYKTINEYNQMHFIYVALSLTVAISFNFLTMMDDST